jgi:hypothetical protein
MPGGARFAPALILAAVMRRLTRFVALALLAWLPLQAAALPALMTVCELDPAHAPMHGAMHDDRAAGHHAHGDHADRGGDGAAGHDGHSGHSTGGHGCCHHFSTAAPAIAIAVPVAAHEAFVTAAIHLHDFFPEQPKRPPLAAL